MLKANETGVTSVTTEPDYSEWAPITTDEMNAKLVKAQALIVEAFVRHDVKAPLESCLLHYHEEQIALLEGVIKKGGGLNEMTGQLNMPVLKDVVYVDVDGSVWSTEPLDRPLANEVLKQLRVKSRGRFKIVRDVYGLIDLVRAKTPENEVGRPWHMVED